MSSYVALELAETALPLGVIAFVAERSARRERARIDRLARTAREGRIPPERAPEDLLTRLHTRRMRRRLARAGLAPGPRRREASR